MCIEKWRLVIACKEGIKKTTLQGGDVIEFFPSRGGIRFLRNNVSLLFDDGDNIQDVLFVEEFKENLTLSLNFAQTIAATHGFHIIPSSSGKRDTINPFGYLFFEP